MTNFKIITRYLLCSDKTSVVFTSDAFLDPVTFLASKVTPEQIELYNNIVRGKSSVSLLKVSDSLAIKVNISEKSNDEITLVKSKNTVAAAAVVGVSIMAWIILMRSIMAWII